ncbi:MAG: hypothetical protein H0V92_12035 [Pseudonocardiales bacterium]|nr:hypothetical protein [Pseudonocardiales bacterium]
MTDPVTLQQLRGMKPGPERIRAITTYIEQGEQTIRSLRKLRDEDVRALVADLGPAQAAQKSGLSPSTVKSINKGHR